MADPSAPLILTALERAVAEPDGLALWSSKAVPGLFSASAAGRNAAQHCKESGLLRVVRAETKGKKPREIWALTEHGLAHLLRETSPRPVIQRLLEAVERSEKKLAEVLGQVEEQRRHLEAFKGLAAKMLEQTPKALSFPWQANGKRKAEEYVLEALRAWHDTRTLGDCPLPELYRRAREAAPKLTIGQFHDALRLLHEQGAIYLHPWTGPLYEMPEPALALLSGHEIAYYVSMRADDVPA